MVAEQGLGDTLQFVRYVPLLRQRGAGVTAIVQPALAEILKSVDTGVSWTSDRTNARPYTWQIDLMSVPDILGTRIDTIPTPVPYLAADPARIGRWRATLGDSGIKVGLAWQGSTGFGDDERQYAAAEGACGAGPNSRRAAHQHPGHQRARAA